MPKTDSVIVKITLLFIFSSISFILFVLYFISSEIDKNNIAIEQRYYSVVDNVNDLLKFGYSLDSLQTYLFDIGYYQVNDEVISKVSQKYLLNYIQNDQIVVNMKKINNHYYITIDDFENKAHFVYTDYKISKDYTTYHLIALLAFITLIFFYILVLKSLLPLSLLRREVNKFANGNMDI